MTTTAGNPALSCLADRSFPAKSTAPAISVVIPVYRNARVAARAIASVLRQTSPAHEIILIDDASGDTELGWLRRWTGRCKSSVPIRLESLSQNVGAGLARHLGANLARGTHVAFLDADDLWHRRKIEEASRTIAQEHVELLGHNRPWSFDLSRQVLNSPINARVSRLSKLNFLMLNPIPTSSIVAHTPIARAMFRFGGRRAEDYMALLVAERMAQRTAFIDAPLAWAPKPPFGYAGEGANQIAIYKASATGIFGLFREGIVNPLDLAIFLAFLAARIPIGLARQLIYRLRYRQTTMDA